MTRCAVCHCLTKNCKCNNQCTDCRESPCKCCERCHEAVCQCISCDVCEQFVEHCQCSPAEDLVRVRQPREEELQQPPVEESQQPQVRLQAAQEIMADDTRTMRVMGEPPVFPKDKKDRKAISLYIAALKRWTRVGGYPKKEQADYIIYHASQKSPEYYEELETKFGESLQEKETGVDEIITWLEEKSGVSRHSEVVRLVTTFYKCTRAKGEDLVDFVTRFEKAYTDVQNLTIQGIDPILKMSATGKSIVLLTAANLNDVDYQIIIKGLRFDEKDKTLEEKVFDNTKAAIINHHVAKQSNHQNNSQPQGSKPLNTFLAGLDNDEELQSIVETYYANKYGGKQGGEKRKFGDTKKRKWKCVYCLCDHPKWKDCECACTKHTKDRCPNPDPKKKEEADKRDAEWKRKKANETSQSATAPGSSSYLTYEYSNYMASVMDSATSAPSVSFLVKPVLSELQQEEEPRSLEEFHALMEEDQQRAQGVTDSLCPTDRGNPTVLQDSDCVMSPLGMVKGVPDLQSDSPRSGGEWSPIMLTKAMMPIKVMPDPQGGQAKGTATRTNQGEGVAKLEVIQPDPMQVLKLGDALLSLTPSEVVSDFPTSCGLASQAVSQDCWDQVYFQGQNLLNQEGDTQQTTMIVDTASPGTIIGQNEFKKLRDSYPKVISKSFKVEQSAKNYQFGGGEKTHSLARVRVPLYIMDTHDNAQLVHIWVEVLAQPEVPFLLGGASLEAAAASINLAGTQSIKLHWEDKSAEFPLYRSKSGHFHMMIMALSQDDENHFITKVIGAQDWTSQELRQVINMVVSTEKEEDRAEIIKRPTGDVATYIAHNKGNRKVDSSRPLRRKEVFKLHHFWGHLHPDKMRDILKRANKVNDETENAIEDLRECEPCKVENRRPPKPRATFQKSVSFNHVIQIDLKENIRYKNAPPYILYIVDVFTKFKAARYIQNKKGETVVEALMLEWVKYFGPPKYIQSDRGKEFLNQHLETFCNIHGVRMTTTASYTPNANGLVERGHAHIDKMMEKMMTADNNENPRIALCWAVQASNCLEMVDGISPHTLVFGRNPAHPTLDSPADPDQMKEVSSRLALQLQTMMAAREAYAAVEADAAVRKALHSRIYTDVTNIKVNDWIYYRTNVNRYWMGPIKVLAKDGKRLHCLKHGSAVVVNSDDVLMHKPEEDVFSPEKYISLQAAAQQENGDQNLTNQSVPAGRDPDSSPGSSHTVVPPSQDLQVQSPDIIEIQRQEYNDRAQPQEAQHGDIQDIPLENSANKTSTANLEDIGNPMLCNMCHSEISSKDIHRHISVEHNILRPNIRSMAQMIDPAPDSLYRNINKLTAGDVIVTKQGRYLELSEEQPDKGWTAEDVVSKELLTLDLVKDMAAMRYVGKIQDSSDQGLNVTNREGQQVFYSFRDHIKKVFVATEHEAEDEDSQKIFVVNIPKSRHSEPLCVAAKEKELKDFDHFDVYETVDQPINANIIGTEWVLVEKDKSDGSRVIKARLCMRGDCEENKHLIQTNSPTANRITIRLLLTMAASQKDRDVWFNDVRRAFLQTEDLSRDVFVRPPIEAGVPQGKVWKLKRACYGLIDASRAYFLRHASELKALGYQPLQFDPATFVLRENGVIKAVYASHVDDCMAVGDTETLQRTQTMMEQKLSYGEVERLPSRFLGINISRSENGDIVLDQDHYVKDLDIPDVEAVKHLHKQDLLSNRFQSVFRSVASKINMLALSSRPDFAYAAKHLTSRYGKATKSDLVQATKLIRKAKEETSKMIIPNIGPMEEWTIVAISDASNKSSTNVFSVSGYVIMIVNKHTNAAAVLTWSSKKIERVTTSSMAAETLALEVMMSKIFLVRRLLEGLVGETANSIPCIALIDSQNLWSCVHNISSCSDDRLQADIINIRQAIHDDKSVQEVRYIHGSEMVADSLTKQTNLTGNKLLNIVRSGYYDLPGGHQLRDSTQVSVKTWSQLMAAEGEADKMKRSEQQSSSHQF